MVIQEGFSSLADTGPTQIHWPKIEAHCVMVMVAVLAAVDRSTWAMGLAASASAAKHYLSQQKQEGSVRPDEKFALSRR
ncbi:hypothetical protein [Mycobacterium malmoense]|uniref:hypothetical protein n=1 Tax=Mycobacterium malmoense TaxID=1780 RepID=UPI00114D499B|nr:hypothetical protein [Mycobacterium malmoense]